MIGLGCAASRPQGVERSPAEAPKTAAEMSAPEPAEPPPHVVSDERTAPAAADEGVVSTAAPGIRGRVTDSRGEVLVGATVVVTGPSIRGTRATITDSEGMFDLPAVPAGDYTVTVYYAEATTSKTFRVEADRGVMVHVRFDDVRRELEKLGSDFILLDGAR